MAHKKPFLEHQSLTGDIKIAFKELRCDCCSEPTGVFGGSVSYEGMNVICATCRTDCYTDDRYHCPNDPSHKLVDGIMVPICTVCIEDWEKHKR